MVEGMEEQAPELLEDLDSSYMYLADHPEIFDQGHVTNMDLEVIHTYLHNNFVAGNADDVSSAVENIANNADILAHPTTDQMEQFIHNHSALSQSVSQAVYFMSGNPDVVADLSDYGVSATEFSQLEEFMATPNDGDATPIEIIQTLKTHSPQMLQSLDGVFDYFADHPDVWPYDAVDQGELQTFSNYVGEQATDVADQATSDSGDNPGFFERLYNETSGESGDEAGDQNQ